MEILKNERISDIIMREIRKGCKDVWNAFMCENTVFSQCDIPYCPTTATEIPKAVITWDEAKPIYKKHRIKGETDFYNDSFVGILTITSLTIREEYGTITNLP